MKTYTQICAITSFSSFSFQSCQDNDDTAPINLEVQDFIWKRTKPIL
jgi:hypothetical protein